MGAAAAGGVRGVVAGDGVGDVRAGRVGSGGGVVEEDFAAIERAVVLIRPAVHDADDLVLAADPDVVEGGVVDGVRLGDPACRAVAEGELRCVLDDLDAGEGGERADVDPAH